MRRGWIVLLAALAAGVLTAAAVCGWQQRAAAPEAWLYREFGLTAEQGQELSAVDVNYRKETGELCERIRKSDARLAIALESGKSLTPEIEAAMTESNALRNECSQRMLKHFYLVADKMPAHQRERYLAMVLPLAMNPTDMDAIPRKK